MDECDERMAISMVRLRWACGTIFLLYKVLYIQGWFSREGFLDPPPLCTWSLVIVWLVFAGPGPLVCPSLGPLAFPSLASKEKIWIGLMRGKNHLKTYYSKEKIRIGLMRGKNQLKTYNSKEKIRIGLMRGKNQLKTYCSKYKIRFNERQEPTEDLLK